MRYGISSRIASVNSHAQRASTKAGVPSLFVGLATYSCISGIVLLVSDAFDVRYVVLLTLAASFASADLFSGLRRKIDFLSPRVLVSALMLNAVYVSPLVLISSNNYPRYIELPRDMHNALEQTAILHLAGVILYYIVLRVLPASGPNRSQGKFRNLDGGFRSRVVRWCVFFGSISLLMYLYTVASSGGPAAWLSSQLNYRDELTTSGWLLALGAAFPTLFFIAYGLSIEVKGLNRQQIRNRVIFALIVLLCVTFVVNGLRGSRANLVWPMLVALIIVHFCFFRIRGKWLLAIGLCTLLFAGVYDIYKKAGVDAIAQLGQTSLESVERQSGADFGLETLIVGDFSRTGAQAILIDRWSNGGFELGAGATYIGDIILFIPGLDPVSYFPSKSVASTDILYGEGTVSTGGNLATRIYGLQGEAVINFGPIGGVLILAPYALIVFWAQRKFFDAKLSKSIPHVILAAVLTPGVFLLYLSDLDNVVNYLSSKALMPLVILWLSVTFVSSRTHISERVAN